jgi:hypothetical protein
MKLTLGDGCLIRLKGTRDAGIRETIRIDGTKIVCHQLRFRAYLSWPTTSTNLDAYVRTGITTMHDLAKVTHIAQAGIWKDLRHPWHSNQQES